MATALYRRYRPEAFSEMIGQAHVTEPLMTALRAGRIGHAYLFSGPRGCGKTTSARILARCLNCAEGPTDTPCGTCPSCIELSREGGGSLDVVEIDAASHGGVDDARELRERAIFAPARDRYKIFIIDEAHMVTSGGFNALLKIVEEPPPHVKFIFATTEPEKVIGTIRSRTHHYPFRLIAPGTLIDYVQQLCDSEGISVESGVLPLVVRSGGGSVRDTLSILDQLIAGSEGSSVGLERASGLLGYTSTELIDEVVGAFATADAAAAFAATDRVVQTGQDPRRFVEDLLERLRDLIVISATSIEGASAVFRGMPEDRLQRMFEQSMPFGPGQLSRIADTVSEALDHMSGATAPRLHLELMIARALIARAQGSPAAAATGAAPTPAAGRAPATGTATQRPAAAPQAPEAPPTPSMPVASAVGRKPASAAAPPAASTPGASAPTAPSVTPSAQPSDAGVDVIATLKSAREFLNSGQAKPPIVPLGGHAPEPRADAVGPAAAAPSTAPAEPHPAPTDAAATAPAAGAAAEPAAGAAGFGISELRELWSELLEELLESDRAAWNAVKNVQPLALEGDLLYIGVTSRTDLDAFKGAGAGPLREVIVAAAGISVKYMPRQVQAPTATGESAEPAPADPEPSPRPEPHPAGHDEPSDEYDEFARAESGSSAVLKPPAAEAPLDAGPGARVDAAPMPMPMPTPPSTPTPTRGEFGDPGFSADRDPTVDPSFAPDLGGDAEDPAGVQGVDPETIDSGSAAAAVPTGSAASAATTVAPAPTAQASRHTFSVGTRYGEAVVREILGARFIEERPVPQERE